jgi:hypothetical protein
MTIRLKPNPTFKFRVKLAVPGSDERAEFTLIGKHQGQKALRAWIESAKELDGRDVTYLAAVVVGWEGVTDDGKPVEFSEEAFATLLDSYAGSMLVVFSAYVEELSAGRAKN